MTTEEIEPVLQVRREGRLAILTLNRPDRLNALSPALHRELTVAVTAAAEDDDVGAVIITGAGRAFCAGGDVDGARDHRAITQERHIDNSIHDGEATRLLHLMPKPTLALINGAAAGAGLALALSCDIRMAASDAIFTTAYAKLALPGDHGVSYFLTRLAGPAVASELLFLSERIDAQTAHGLGLVNRVLPPDKLIEEGMAVGKRLSEGPPIAFRYMKRNIQAVGSRSLAELIEREATCMVRCARTHDAKEALLARREKREPRFSGT
jgi:2-(1,2-epoxy-1,2-dihydrophenyl)acetyl-CoA isomerase